MAISNEIISEYAEILELRTNSIVVINIIDFLSKSTNVDKVEVYYRWNLIEIDKDDNKFVDCAVAGNVQFIVTNDRHFNVLKDINFPKVEIISSTDFLEKIKERK